MTKAMYRFLAKGHPRKEPLAIHKNTEGPLERAGLFSYLAKLLSQISSNRSRFHEKYVNEITKYQLNSHIMATVDGQQYFVPPWLLVTIDFYSRTIITQSLLLKRRAINA